MQNTVTGHASALLGLAMLFAGCAATNHPCFEQGITYPHRSSSCQYGRAYHCDDGDWIAARRSCTSSDPVIAAPLAPTGSCESNGILYTDGSARCYGGSQYRCENGHWLRINLPCSFGDAPVSLVPGGLSCSYRGTAVSNSSAICQSGITYLCNDGQWVNLGTSCR